MYISPQQGQPINKKIKFVLLKKAIEVPNTNKNIMVAAEKYLNESFQHFTLDSLVRAIKICIPIKLFDWSMLTLVLKE